MTSAIKNLIEEANKLLVCPSCRGQGEVEYFCGHYTTTSCSMCAGNGFIKLREGCAKTVDIDKLYREPWLPNRYFFFPSTRMA